MHQCRLWLCVPASIIHTCHQHRVCPHSGGGTVLRLATTNATLRSVMRGAGAGCVGASQTARAMRTQREIFEARRYIKLVTSGGRLASSRLPPSRKIACIACYADILPQEPTAATWAPGTLLGSWCPNNKAMTRARKYGLSLVSLCSQHWHTNMWTTSGYKRHCKRWAASLAVGGAVVQCNKTRLPIAVRGTA